MAARKIQCQSYYVFFPDEMDLFDAPTAEEAANQALKSWDVSADAGVTVCVMDMAADGVEKFDLVTEVRAVPRVGKD